MKPLLWLAIASQLSFGFDSVSVRTFLEQTVTPSTATYLGFSPFERISSIEFGQVLELQNIDSDSLNSYPETGFSSSAQTQYLPLIVDDSVRSFVVLNAQGNPVSIGYVQLAQEITKIASYSGVALEDITLYRSTLDNSYYFSVPSRERSAAANLTRLEPNWDRTRGSLTSEETSIANLKKIATGGSK